MQSSLIKKISSVALCALIAALCLSLVACGGKSDEEIIREGVTSEFESIKNQDEEMFNQVLGGFSQSGDLEEYGISNEEFVKSWLSGFDYSIDNVVVDGDNATVSATVTVKSLEQAVTDFTTELFSMASDEANADLSEEELNQKLGTVLMSAVDNAPMVTNSMELPYVLRDNEWAPGAGFNEALSQGFVGELA